MGASGAAGAVGAARRAAADIVQTALSNVGLEASADGTMRPGVTHVASGGGAVSTGGWDGGGVRHPSDGPRAGTGASSPAPVQRIAEDERDEAQPSAAAMQDRLAELMDALEARILAQIERRGGRYRGMFS